MNTEIRVHPKKGRGVFALDKVKKGDLVETCHLIIMDLMDISGPLEGYVYQFSKEKVAIALGNGSLYNHNDHANCEFSFDYKNKMLLIRAIKNILPEEEITINYRYSKEDREKFQIIH
jgi:SET domain-containing protein